MAIIYSYPIVTPTSNDLVLGTDVDAQGKPTKNFTVKSIIDLATVSGNDLQAVLDNGNSATQNIVLTGNVSATRYTDGTMVVVGGVGSGFTSFTSVDFLGDITGILKAGSSIQSTVTGVTQPLGTNNTTLATTAFVMSKVDPSVLQYLGDATGPFDLNLVTDDFKISGTANQIETTATTVGGNVGAINLKFPTTGVTLPDGSIATTQALTDNSTKVATTAFVQGKNDAQTLEFDGDTGSSTVLLNSQTLAIEGTTDQITTTVSAQKVKFTLPTNVTIGGIFTGVTFSGDLNGTVNTATTGTTQTAGDNSTKIATTAYVDSASGSKTLSYKDTSATVNTMNLTDDDLQFTGGSNITSTATAVATNIADIKFDLDDSVTISGTMKADTFTTTAGTATWVTTVLDGFTAITSDLFTGPLTGNADTATALASSGAIAITGDTTSTGGPYTYTSGGAISIATTIADTTVTAKVLTNLATPTSSAIAATDTILAAMAKLQGQITGLAGSLAFEGTWDARTVAEGGAGTPPSATPANGQFWIVSVAGSQDLSGITDWLVGDWAIYVSNGAGTDAWQKLDQSNEVLGSGAANKIAKWTSTNTLASGLIDDDGTTVTVGNSGNLIVEGNTTLGDADTDTTTVKGPAIFEFATRFNKGISLGAATYGTAGQVLTSGGGSASVNTWTTPTTGTVESVTAGAGIVLTGDAVDPVVNVDYLGTDNVVLSAGTAVTPVGADTIIINDATTGNVVKALISNLPFNSYSWDLNVDSGTGVIISNSEEVDFLSGTGIIQSLSTRDVTTALRYQDSDNSGTIKNFMEAASTTTPVAADFLVFSHQNGSSGKNIVRKATIANIVDLGNETLTQVLANGNNSGGAKNINMTGAVSNITLVDSGTAAASNAAQGRIKIGSGDDLQLYHNGTSSFIANATGDLNISSNTSIQLSFLSGEAALLAIKDNQLNLYYNGLQRMNTSSAGITVSGTITSGDVNTSGLLGSRVQLARNAVPTVNNILGTIGFRGNAFGGTTLSVIDTAAIQASAEIDWAANVYGTRLTFKTTTGQTQSTALTLRGDNDAEFTGNVEIDGNLTVDGNIIHGNGKSGIFYGRAATNNSTVDLFKITRTGNSFQGGGQLIFDVFATSELAGGGVLKYTVAHAFNQTPLYNKIIDYQGANTMTLAFTNSTSSGGTTGDSVLCQVTTNSTQNISYTVQVGYSFANTVVVS